MRYQVVARTFGIEKPSIETSDGGLIGGVAEPPLAGERGTNKARMAVDARKDLT